MNFIMKNKKISVLLILIGIIFFVSLPSLAVTENSFSNGYNGLNDKVTIGGNVHLTERVNGTAVTILGNTDIEEGTNGDAVAIGGNVKVRGIINGSVVAIAGDATVDGIVNGDVVAIGGKVILKENTVVNGQVVSSDIQKEDNVSIKGDVVNTNIPYIKLPKVHGEGISIATLVLWLKVSGFFISLLLISLVAVLFPNAVEVISRSVERDTLRGLGIGFIAFIILIPLCITIIGIPVAVILLVAAKYLGFAGVVLFFGRKFMQGINRQGSPLYIQVIIGFLLISLVELIPFVGWIISLLLFWLSMGAMLDTKFGTGRPWFNRV